MSWLPSRLSSRVDPADLEWIVRTLLPGSTLVEDLRTGRERPDGGGLVVVPTSQRPLMILSAAPTRTTWRMLRSHAGLRSNGDRLVRGYAAISATRPARVLEIQERRGAGFADLVDRLRESLPVRHAAVTLGRRDPNRKPTVELFDERGRVLGYLKVGWNDVTSALVGRENRALRRLEGAGPDPGRPCHASPLLFDRWQGRTLLVTRPMPGAARRWRGHTPPPATAGQAAARALGDTRVEDLGRVPLWEELETSLQECSDGPQRYSARRLRTALARAREAASSERVEVAGWHGDWSPWNLARVHDQIWMWDFEHTGEGVPVGIDAANWEFQVGTTLLGLTAAEAVSRLRALLPDRLAPWGLSPAAAQAVGTLYLGAMWTRSAGLAAANGSWNPVVEPGIPDALGALVD